MGVAGADEHPPESDLVGDLSALLLDDDELPLEPPPPLPNKYIEADFLFVGALGLGVAGLSRLAWVIEAAGLVAATVEPDRVLRPLVERNKLSFSDLLPLPWRLSIVG